MFHLQLTLSFLGYISYNTLHLQAHSILFSLSFPLYFSILCSSPLVCVLGAFVSMLTFLVLFLRFYARMPFWPLSPVNLAFPLLPLCQCHSVCRVVCCMNVFIHEYICCTRSYIFIVDFYGHLLMQKLFEQNKQNETKMCEKVVEIETEL